MEKSVTLKELSMMTGLTIRTLRSYLRTGILVGDKEDGVWQFSMEEVGAFMFQPVVKQSVQAKRNAVVNDFMLDRHKNKNEICTILDINASEVEAGEVMRFFCDAVKDKKDVRFFCDKWKNHVRVIVKGDEKDVLELMKCYYQRKNGL